MEYRRYFELRQVRPDDYTGFELPAYLSSVLGRVQRPRILDFGCGFGQWLQALKRAGFTDVEGVDIEPEAVEHCRAQSFKCFDASAYGEPVSSRIGQFDFILMSHVLEHFPKADVIPQLEKIRGLLKPGGALVVMVPNAQSHTGAYWAYEDFTHHLLFTFGSLYYVLKAAGFIGVEFLDIDCTEGLPALKRLAKKFLLFLYTLNYRFWNRVTSSSIHEPSPMILSYEIKALARVDQT